MKTKRICLICPIRGDGQPGRVEENMRKAIDWKVRMSGDGVESIVPFLVLREVLDDSIPEHREAGLAAGRAIMGTCHEAHVVLFGQEVSEGMQGDIDFLKRKGIPVVWGEEKQ